MKTFTFSSFLLLIGLLVSAQSQRLTLLEEFTQASCAPCAAQNPALNALLYENDANVVSLKYQTSWPGTDPMNAQNPSQVASRVSYYNVGGVPFIKYDGNVALGGTLPQYLNQTKINNQVSVLSPFDIMVNHSISGALDSVFIDISVTATQAANYTGDLKLHVALVEREIHFANPPGTNGEKEFYNIMRKMYPGPQGTILQDSWALNDVYNISFAEAIPNYIYNKGQLAVVVFIQDDFNKNVKQAAYSPPLGYDAAVKSIDNLSSVVCATTVTPDVIIKNNSGPTITSANINYQLNGGTTQTINWTGNLAFGEFATVTLPNMSVASGQNSLMVSVSDPNGQIDYGSQNNSKTKTFLNVLSAMPAPIVESFQATSFPPVNWGLDNPDGGYTWQRKSGTGGFGLSNASAYIQFFYYGAQGALDYLYPPSFDLTGIINPELSFDVAYAPYGGTFYDGLQVQISNDCGSTWSTVYNKSNTVLATAPATGNVLFTPTPTQWRKETIGLSNYIGEPHVLARFVAVNGYGNNLYLDHINIGEQIVSVSEISHISGVSIFPNPVSEIGVLSFELNESKEMNINLFNMLGEKVLNIADNKIEAGKHTVEFDVTGLDAGVYFITLTSEEGTMSRKVTIVK